MLYYTYLIYVNLLYSIKVVYERYVLKCYRL